MKYAVYLLVYGFGSSGIIMLLLSLCFGLDAMNRRPSRARNKMCQVACAALGFGAGFLLMAYVAWSLT